MANIKLTVELYIKEIAMNHDIIETYNDYEKYFLDRYEATSVEEIIDSLPDSYNKPVEALEFENKIKAYKTKQQVIEHRKKIISILL